MNTGERFFAACFADRALWERAETFVTDFSCISSDFAALCRVPQSPPHHREGAQVRDHVVRMLVAWQFLQQPQAFSFFDVDVLRAHEGFFLRFFQVIVRERSLLLAYIFAHDIAKKDVATQDASGWHYPQHAYLGASPRYAPYRAECLAFAGAPLVEGKFLSELIRIHIDVLRDVTLRADTEIFVFAGEVARKQGLNSARFLDLLAPAFFLDVLLGSDDANSSPDSCIDAFLFFIAQEYRAYPERAHQDGLFALRKRRDARKNLLGMHGLSAEVWFETLHTPFGEERGKVAALLERFIRGVEDAADVVYVGQVHADELRARSSRLRAHADYASLFL